LISFPNAKINLGLNVISKRPDGYHNIESCFYPVPWHDVLEIIPSNSLTFTSSGIAIPGSSEDNLCLKAYQLLNVDFKLAPVKIHLHKNIPIGAGLGGGSSDGAFVLKSLNSKFQLGLSDNELEVYAAQLGSDCPFFIKNKPTLAINTGTDFSSIEVDLEGKFLVIIKPNIHVSTADAYNGIVIKPKRNAVKEVVEKFTISRWKNELINDFEETIFNIHPEIEAFKSDLYKNGALYASMTGSGAAVYGIFEKETTLEPHKDWTVFRTQL